MNEHDTSRSVLVETSADTPDTPSSELVSQDSDDPLERVPDVFRVDYHEGLIGQRCLKSRLDFEVGDVLASFSARRHCKKPHRMTVQVGESSHIELAPLCIELINHSCDPNVFFDVTRMEIVALRAIAPGDELTFFYPSTEWRMESPFDCACGSHRCLTRIDGASRLGRVSLSTHRLNRHIEAALLDLDERERTDRAFDIGLFQPVWERLTAG